MVRLATALVLLPLLSFSVAACGRTRTPPASRPGDASPDADASPDGSSDASSDAAADGGVDGGPRPPCEALSPAACLERGCVPTYDDACCPTCTPEGFCADCFDPDFFICRSFEDACMAAFCSFPAPGGCDGAIPDCVDATPFDETSCTVAGCVPAVAPIGAPPSPTICVPITASSCTALCRIEPPPCPDGTVPEGDGSCYTNRCIPAVVCL